MKQKLILIGSGMAGTRFLEHLLKNAGDKYEVSVFNQEPYGGYNRIMLSPVLAGEATIEEIMTHKEAWFSSNGIHFKSDCYIQSINSQEKKVTDQTGCAYSYDHLVIATGSTPFILPVPGTQLKGVVSFREIRDVHYMQSIAKPGKKAVVIGAGLLGLEAAYGLIKLGMQVTVVHRNAIVMNAQLDAEAGGLLEQRLSSQLVDDKGIDFRLSANVTEIIADLPQSQTQAQALNEHSEQQVTHVELDSGEVLETDLVVMAIGIRPNIKIGKSAGIEIEKGILVNDYLETSDPNIYALGECTQHNGQTYGLVAPIYEQAEILAENLAGNKVSYKGTLTATMLKVTGVNLFSAGDFLGSEKTESIIFRDLKNAIYRKLVLQENRLIGACLYGDTTDGNWLFEKIKTGESIASIRENLVFGKGF